MRSLLLRTALWGAASACALPTASHPSDPAAHEAPSEHEHDVRDANPSAAAEPRLTDSHAAAAGSALSPCVAGTPAHQEATAKLHALGKLIEALDHNGDPRPANEALSALRKHPCWVMSIADQHDELVADSALALKTWWDRGARWWLEHYLDLGDADAERSWVPAPDMPATLTLNDTPNHPLSPILCGRDDVNCGAATRGWLERAATHFELYARKRRDNRSDDDECGERLRTVDEKQRYDAWVACQKKAAPEVEALPLGGFKAPVDGWLVLQGRRGHYGFCDEIRAFGLKRGTMYAAKSCSGLALRTDGSVDQRATDAARKPELVAARVNLENLREAALMVLLSSQAQGPGTWHAATGRPIPQGLIARRNGGGRIGGGWSGSSGHTTLSWSWVRQGKVIVSGKLQWPDDLNHAARDHAIKLIQIVEAAHVPGCAPERLDTLPLPAARSSVSSLDADATSLRHAADTLVNGMAELRQSAKICR